MPNCESAFGRLLPDATGAERPKSAIGILQIKGDLQLYFMHLHFQVVKFKYH